MRKKMIIDLWYDDTLQECDGLTYSFSDCDCVYRGNILKNGRFVGDYTTSDFQKIEKLYHCMNGGKRDDLISKNAALTACAQK